MEWEKKLEQLPKYIEWKKGNPDISLEFLANSMHMYQWCAIFSVLFPNFVDIDGCVIWKSQYSGKPLSEIKESLQVDDRGVEKSFNRIRTSDLFYNDPDYDNLSDDFLYDVAQRIAETWRLHLHSSFPQYSFKVEITDDPEMTITAFRKEGGSE